LGHAGAFRSKISIDIGRKSFIRGGNMLNLERASELNSTMVTEESLLLHEKNVCYAMGAMAEHFG
jgi:hypothetical protein